MGRRLAWVLVLGLVGVGCNGSGGTSDNVSQTGPENPSHGSGGSTDVDRPGDSEPGKIVVQVLEAMRQGNDERISALYTPLARMRSLETAIGPAVAGSDTAWFNIDGLIYRSDDLAEVQNIWSDIDSTTGNRESGRMTWVVRRVSEGWRIAGMTAQVIPGQPPIFLDFEHPEETARKIDELTEEIRRRAQAEVVQAQRTQPTDTSPPHTASRQSTNR